jgi:hypothetical protein
LPTAGGEEGKEVVNTGTVIVFCPFFSGQVWLGGIDTVQVAVSEEDSAAALEEDSAAAVSAVVVPAADGRS